MAAGLGLPTSALVPCVMGGVRVVLGLVWALLFLLPVLTSLLLLFALHCFLLLHLPLPSLLFQLLLVFLLLVPLPLLTLLYCLWLLPFRFLLQSPRVPSSLPPPAPPGFPIGPSVHPTAPFMGLRPLSSFLGSFCCFFVLCCRLPQALRLFSLPLLLLLLHCFLVLRCRRLHIFFLSRLLLWPFLSPGLCRRSLRARLLRFLSSRLLFLL